MSCKIFTAYFRLDFRVEGLKRIQVEESSGICKIVVRYCICDTVVCRSKIKLLRSSISEANLSISCSSFETITGKKVAFMECQCENMIGSKGERLFSRFSKWKKSTMIERRQMF